MIEGTSIAESLREGASLEGSPLTVRAIHRGRAPLSPEQAAAGPPEVWTIIDFETNDDQAGTLAEELSHALDSNGGYVNVQSKTTSFIVFPEHVFHDPRGDPRARAEARAYGRQLGIPEPQRDWTV